MNYRDFKAAVSIDGNVPRDYEKIVFRTPDGTNYHNVTIDFGYWNNSKDKAMIINLFNIKPKFKVGDVVTNNGGLHPNVKCTIAEVNEELEYYSYKEVNGRTYFKNQDELKLVSVEPKFHVGDVVTNISGLYPNITSTINEVDILNQCYKYKEIGGVTWFKEQDNLKLVNNKPIFKIGDKVKGASSEEPEKEFIINSINEDIKCYHYFNGNGIITMFKDQHKLTLVQTDNCGHPVKDEVKFAKSIISAIEAIKNTNLKGSITFNIPKNIDTFKLGCELSGNKYLKISAELSNNGTDVITIKW